MGFLVSLVFVSPSQWVPSPQALLGEAVRPESRVRGGRWLLGSGVHQSHNAKRTVLDQGGTPGDEATVEKRGTPLDLARNFMSWPNSKQAPRSGARERAARF